MRPPPSGGSGQAADDYVEVYDEPDHRPLLDNAHVYAYRVCLSPRQATLWHRHTEDTVYFSLAAARGREDLPAAGAVVTEIPCARAVSRPHRGEPLIHRVTNIGATAFHLIGAEAHARPDPIAPPPIAQPGHRLALETDRFRVYRVSPEAGARPTPYPSSGLIVALTAGRLRLASTTMHLDAGQVCWVDADARCTPDPDFDGFFAQWR